MGFFSEDQVDKNGLADSGGLPECLFEVWTDFIFASQATFKSCLGFFLVLSEPDIPLLVIILASKFDLLIRVDLWWQWNLPKHWGRPNFFLTFLLFFVFVKLYMFHNVAFLSKAYTAIVLLGEWTLVWFLLGVNSQVIKEIVPLSEV